MIHFAEAPMSGCPEPPVPPSHLDASGWQKATCCKHTWSTRSCVPCRDFLTLPVQVEVSDARGVPAHPVRHASQGNRTHRTLAVSEAGGSSLRRSCSYSS